MSGAKFLRNPVPESWRMRTASWWQGLTTRERWLVGVLGALLGGAIVILGIIQPLQAARAGAIADIRTYETLAARVRAAGTLTPGTPKAQLREGTPAEAATAAARDAGITANIAPGGAGLAAQIADAPYEGVIGWIGDIERTTTLRVQRVELRKGATAGRVSATVEFAP